jgi:hypothetical protein
MVSKGGIAMSMVLVIIAAIAVGVSSFVHQSKPFIAKYEPCK